MRRHSGTPPRSWGETPCVTLVRYHRATEAVLAVRAVRFFHFLVGLCTLATGLAGPAHADSGWMDEVKRKRN